MPAPLVIEAAVNGGTPKARNPNVPRSVAEVVESGLAAAGAGAGVLHNHTDDPNLGGSGRHSAAPYAEAWPRLLARQPELVLYPTMAGGGPHTDIAERVAHQVELAEAGLLRALLIDPGSLNFGNLGPDGPDAGESVYINTFGDVAHLMSVARERRLAPMMSVYEPGFLQLIRAYERAGLLPAGGMVRLYFCGGGAFGPLHSFGFGLPPTERALEAYLEMLAGSRLPWMVAVLGGDVVECGMAELAIRRGGHVRVGLEDFSGDRQPTNEELVGEVAQLAHRLGRPVATARQASDLVFAP